VSENTGRFLGLSSPPSFLIDAYALVEGGKEVSVVGSLKITSAYLLFSSPSGHLLKVHARWPERKIGQIAQVTLSPVPPYPPRVYFTITSRLILQLATLLFSQKS